MIITYQQLWKDFDPKSIALNTSVVTQVNAGEYSVKTVYFNGLSCDNGVCRIFAKLISPQVKTGKAIIVMDEIQNGVDKFDFSGFISEGYSVLIVDYAGFSTEYSRFTIYPKCFSTANYNNNVLCLAQLPPSLKASCRYIWTTVMLCAVFYMEEAGFCDIGLYGIGEGGSQVIKALALLPQVKCGAVLFSSSRVSQKDEKDYDEDLVAYAAALADWSYSPFLKSPLFIQTTSNEQNSSLDKMSKIFSSAGDAGALIAISPRSDRTVCENQKDNIKLFFETVFGSKKLLKPPKITPKNSDNSLYLHINADTAEEIESAELFVAHAQKIGAYRNWQNKNLEKTGAGDFISKIQVYSALDPIFAFFNVKYKNGFCISSAVAVVLPGQMNIEIQPFVPKRLIFDVESGSSEWILKGEAENNKLFIEKGPFDIEGITAKSNRLATFALSDKLFSPPKMSSLQLIVYSSVNQPIQFSLKTSVDNQIFSVSKTLDPADSWTKITLSPQDFRSSDGSMQSWNNIVTLELCAEHKFLINTMLWI